MEPLSTLDILFIAGFGPITGNTEESKSFYVDLLGLPLVPMEGNEDYLLSRHGELGGVKHFALWPLSQAAASCFGTDTWPSHLPVPQGWIEFEVYDLNQATEKLVNAGHRLLIANREESWGQIVTRLLSPEGLLVGLTITPWLRDHAD